MDPQLPVHCAQMYQAVADTKWIITYLFSKRKPDKPTSRPLESNV